MFWKKWLKDYLTFGRRDRIGILALVILIVIMNLLPLLFRRKETRLVTPPPLVAEAADSLETKGRQEKKPVRNEEWPSAYEPAETGSYRPGELFRFDPNTLPVNGWQRLGLSERLGKTIEKYRHKGGKFYKPEDLQRIWGLPPGFYERVKDHIEIPGRPAHSGPKLSAAAGVPLTKELLTVDVNTADTSALIALPWIGGKLAVRIVMFREKLGGFYSVDQIAETYGLQDSVFQKIKGRLTLTGTVRKLNPNTCTKEELKAHPYFKWSLANAIVEYRNQHGPFKTLEELKNIAAISEETFGRIVNYLSL